jgi:hypothetical protein
MQLNIQSNLIFYQKSANYQNQVNHYGLNPKKQNFQIYIL